MKTTFNLKAGLFTLILFSSATLFAQSTKNISINNFSAVTISSGIDLYLNQGNAEGVKLVGDKDALDEVVVEKDGTSLKIHFRSGYGLSNFFQNRSLKAYLSFKTLNALSASGGSDVFTQNTLRTNKIDINASGGSDLKLDLVCKDISLNSSGGSDIDLKGSATNMELHTSGGSDVNALNFKVENARVNASGGSDAYIYVNNALDANASGGSDIHYKGNASVKKNASKSGDVIKIN